MQAWRPAEGSPSKRLVFDKRKSHSGVAITVPCGQCVGCRLERSRQWAMRCLHEKQLHRHNCFVTLTYDNDHLPEGGSLVKRDLQLFMKRLRERFGAGIRFYACGEYGDETSRPHYHALLFNHDFSDRKLVRESKSKNSLFSSKECDLVWGQGNAIIGDVTFDSAAYVARYIMKKITGDDAAEHYSRVSPDGRVYSVLPEFTVMSRRPGIGLGWFEKYGSHVYELDSVVINGREVRPPRYYDTKFEVSADNVVVGGLRGTRLDDIKAGRRDAAARMRSDNTRGYHGRLSVKERVTLAALSQKKGTI